MTAEQMDAGADTTPAADEGRVLYPRKLRGRPVMAFASVTREQFEIRSEVGAVQSIFRPELIFGRILTAIPTTCCKVSR